MQAGETARIGILIVEREHEEPAVAMSLSDFKLLLERIP